MPVAKTDVKDRETKNPDAPGGRRDWIGRTPRERFQVNAGELAILVQWAEYFQVHSDEGKFDPRHQNLLLKIHNAQERIQTPLVAETENYGLFDEATEVDFGASG